jgi:cell division protein FtsL
MYGCLITLLILIVAPILVVTVTIYRNFRALSDRFKHETQQKEQKKKKDQWQKPDSSSNAPHDSKKIIQDDEGEYVDFEEV